MKINNTQDSKYAEYLIKARNSGWKSLFDVQRPYRSYLKKLDLGTTLDIGCGVGRSLMTLPKKSVGIDHNKYMIDRLKSLGYNAFTTYEFDKFSSKYKNYFDSILIAHVIEHLTTSDTRDLIGKYTNLLKKWQNINYLSTNKRFWQRLYACSISQFRINHSTFGIIKSKNKYEKVLSFS